MPLCFDGTHIEGLFSIDGYVDISNRLAGEVAGLIIQRYQVNNSGTA
jgi:hypothetical protein